MNIEQAVIIATRNRPEDLSRTLSSVAAQDDSSDVLTVVVDGSDEKQSKENEQHLAQLLPTSSSYLAYPYSPSLPRQRNYGLDHLPDSVKYVHFIDDDVTLLPGYFQHLTESLRENPEVGGVGGLITEPNRPSPESASRIKRLFLLGSPTPGRVLPSGHVTPVQQKSRGAHRTCWLNGVSSYRRAVFNAHRFDDVMSGYALREDLDFSYRVGREWKLVVSPKAKLIHHASEQNRYEAEHFAYKRIVHRYWFVEKNIRHPLRKLAFWWATLGQALARLTSHKPEAPVALRGLWRGVKTVWRRDHALLHRDSQDR